MSNDSAVFPYGIALRADSTIGTFPAANVFVENAAGERVLFVCLIDSGASISALPKNDAELLGVAYKKGERIQVAGVGGQSMKGWVHSLKIFLGPTTLRAPFAFLDSDAQQRIVGRAGVFDQFTLNYETPQ